MGRLKGIPNVLSPDLLHTLASMGHGDEIVLADTNFPTSSICRCGPKELRADGHGIPSLLEAILKLMPLDTYVDSPAAVMNVVPEDEERGMPQPKVWALYQQIVSKAEGKPIVPLKMERFAFYQRAKTAFAVVHTGETALYGNIILKMGVIP